MKKAHEKSVHFSAKKADEAKKALAHLRSEERKSRDSDRREARNVANAEGTKTSTNTSQTKRVEGFQAVLAKATVAH